MLKSCSPLHNSRARVVKPNQVLNVVIEVSSINRNADDIFFLFQRSKCGSNLGLFIR